MTVPVPGTNERAAAVFRQVLVSVFLVVFAFVQDPRLVAADTKIDLTVDPWGFLGRALHLWDPLGAAGQLQNQAYGYLFPMGPFHALLHSAGLPAWVVQRLWWSLLLLLAYHGCRLLAGRMGIGTAFTASLGALAYALSPRITGGLGSISVEVWPMAMAPWVLLPLIRPRPGTERRSAARSAVAVLCVGGVNAVATGAVLVLPTILLVLRLRDRASRRVLLWWVPSVVAATLWWVVPLLLLGRYSPPFLDWIESASVTTSTASLPEALRGTTHWIAAVVTSGGPQWPAAFTVLTSRATVLAGLEIAVLGCWGLARSDLRHARFLQLGLVAGLVLLTLGHTGPLAPPWADTLQHLLDGPLAPMRNVHKFDLVARLPIALGLAHVLAAVRIPTTGRVVVHRVLQGVTILAVTAMVLPTAVTGVTQRGSYLGVPDWWKQAADFLGQRPHDRTLVLPGSQFYQGLWGAPRDEPLQPLASAPWIVRDGVPLGSAGATRQLNAVEQLVTQGRGGDELANLLRGLGVSRVLVRADLDWRATGAPAPLVVRRALLDTPGVQPGRPFGPYLGGSPRADVAVDDGIDQGVPMLQVFDVAGSDPVQPTLSPASTVSVATGGPEAAARETGHWVLASDRDSVGALRRAGGALRTIGTDTAQRREASFAAIRDSYGPPLRADEAYSATRSSHDWLPTAFRVPTDQTVAQVTGGAVVTASSSLATPLLGQQLQLAQGPYAAFDANGETAWVSAREATGSWVRVAWPRRVAPGGALTVRFDATRSADVSAVEVRTENGRARTGVDPIAGTGDQRNQSVVARVPEGPTRYVEVRIAAVRGRPGAPVAVADIGAGALPSTAEALRVPDAGRADEYRFAVTRDSRRPCVEDVDGYVRCQIARTRQGEEEHALRRVVPGAQGGYTVAGTVVARPGDALEAMLDTQQGVRVSSPSRWTDDPQVRPGTVVDGDPATYWASDPADSTPELTLRLGHEQTFSELVLETAPAITGARPMKVRVTVGGQSFERAVQLDGTIHLPRTAARTVTVTILAATTSRTVRTGGVVGPMPVVIGELRVGKQAWPALDPEREVGRVCGFGPELVVEGKRVPTEVTGSAAAIVAGRPVRYAACEPVSLGDDVEVSSNASAEFLPDTLVLRSRDATVATASTASDTVLGWKAYSATSRSVDVATSDGARVLGIDENANPGWRATLGGRPQTPVMLHGWNQGWVVPAGAGGVVSLEFTPQRPFLAGLVVGLFTALLVVLLAFWPARGGTRAAAEAPRARRAVRAPSAVPLVLAAAGTVALGGLWAVLALAVAALVVRRSRSAELLVLLTGTLMVGVAAWAPWSHPAATNRGALATGLALLLVAALVAASSLRQRPAGPAPGRAPSGSAGAPIAGPGARAGTSSAPRPGR